MIESVAGTMRKGCIVMLAFGFEKLISYNKTVLVRNRSIRDYLYSGALEDVIIFHEGNILMNHQAYIQSATPDMPIRFENISAVFQDFRVVNNSLCPPSILSDPKNTPRGYNSMCYFWFVAFRDYVKAYDWMIRIDDDCVLHQDVRNSIQQLRATTNVHFASPAWLDLSRGHVSRFDRISDKAGGPEGMVVRGLRKLTVAFAEKHNYPRPIKSWKAPYTNVMYLDLDWLRNNTIITLFTQAVVDSGCIYGNRWGDLPLWGAALLLAQEPHTRFQFPYYHGSHNTYIKS